MDTEAKPEKTMATERLRIVRLPNGVILIATDKLKNTPGLVLGWRTVLGEGKFEDQFDSTPIMREGAEKSLRVLELEKEKEELIEVIASLRKTIKGMAGLGIVHTPPAVKQEVTLTVSEEIPEEQIADDEQGSIPPPDEGAILMLDGDVPDAPPPEEPIKFAEETKSRSTSSLTVLRKDKLVKHLKGVDSYAKIPEGATKKVLIEMCLAAQALRDEG